MPFIPTVHDANMVIAIGGRCLSYTSQYYVEISKQIQRFLAQRLSPAYTTYFKHDDSLNSVQCFETEERWLTVRHAMKMPTVAPDSTSLQ